MRPTQTPRTTKNLLRFARPLHEQDHGHGEKWYQLARYTTLHYRLNGRYHWFHECMASLAHHAIWIVVYGAVMGVAV